ncbi:DUF134 domain-containing protein [Propionivibrio limicola]|uniref:DUF134 domain-containing protein n=1 Tax=Propionivibrio limicola TaxID=167645 RepID=UPI001291B978|nr:DUF134 domain-containing protein [Propionivibrio limicola]
MSRPIKCRKVECKIPVRYFKPQGVPMRLLDEIELAMDEIEAMRLTGIEDLYQADAAERMGVSRQTLGNILARAHKKVAIALIEGKALRIAGGDDIRHLPPANDAEACTTNPHPSGEDSQY